MDGAAKCAAVEKKIATYGLGLSAEEDVGFPPAGIRTDQPWVGEVNADASTRAQTHGGAKGAKCQMGRRYKIGPSARPTSRGEIPRAFQAKSAGEFRRKLIAPAERTAESGNPAVESLLRLCGQGSGPRDAER
jgi:hypothetical protein